LVQADGVLRQAEAKWGNALGVQDRYLAYMDAVHDTYLSLKQAFAIPDVGEGLRSVAYWNLLSMAGGHLENTYTTDPGVAANMNRALRSENQALSVEIETQIRALAAVRTQLEALKKLAARPGVPVVYDTNMLNHWRQPDHVVWRDIFRAQGEKVPLTRLVIPLRVLDELDGQKYGQGDLARKAATAIRFIERALKGSQPGMPAQVREDATLEVWHDTNDRGSDTDLLIIQCAIDLSNLQPGATVRLLTGDIGMRLRAEQEGLTTMGLPEDHRRNGTALDDA
jgi:rRNA-processing protein FCF1